MQNIWIWIWKRQKVQDLVAFMRERTTTPQSIENEKLKTMEEYKT